MTEGEFPKRNNVPIIGEADKQHAENAAKQKDVVDYILSQAAENQDPIAAGIKGIEDFRDLCLSRASQFEMQAGKVFNEKGSLQLFHMLVGQAEAYRVVHNDLGLMLKNVEAKPS